MNNYRTISVEPAKLTLADKNNKELAAEKLRINMISYDKAPAKDKVLINILVPSQSLGLKVLNKYILPLRALFSALLIIFSVSLFQSGTSLGVAIISLIVGSCLAVGFMTRITMGLSALFFAALGIVALRSGITDINAFTLMFGSALFFITGSGQFSADRYIRKSLSRYIINRKKTQRIERLSYKAFNVATKNL